MLLNTSILCSQKNNWLKIISESFSCNTDVIELRNQKDISKYDYEMQKVKLFYMTDSIIDLIDKIDMYEITKKN